MAVLNACRYNAIKERKNLFFSLPHAQPKKDNVKKHLIDYNGSQWLTTF